jgi:hypothetical protein
MRILLYVIGVVLAFSGTVWALQGIGLLPGRLMHGQPQWIVYGALALAAGIALILVARRLGRATP